MSGKRPSAASIQRGREYMDWLASLPTDFEDSRRAQYEMSRVRDESYERFMKLRRVERDRARWKKIVSDRRIHRSQQQQELGTKRERPINPESQRQRKLAARAADPNSVRRGRPVNPNSQRQQQLAARAKRRNQKEVEEQRRVLREAREKELVPLGINAVLPLPHSRKRTTSPYYNVPPGVQPPEWMLSPDYTGYDWRVYSRDFRLVKWGPRLKASDPDRSWWEQDLPARWLSSGWDDPPTMLPHEEDRQWKKRV